MYAIRSYYADALAGLDRDVGAFEQRLGAADQREAGNSYNFV